MRTSILLLVLAAIVLAARRVHTFNGCELVGHDAHWATPTLRTCSRCAVTWRRDPGDLAATTTNQPGGW